jgi:hypothetical protein
MKLNKQTTVKTKCHDNRLQNRSSLPIFFLPTGTPGHRIRFPQSGNFLEGGDAVSRFLTWRCLLAISSSVVEPAASGNEDETMVK